MNDGFFRRAAKRPLLQRHSAILLDIENHLLKLLPAVITQASSYSSTGRGVVARNCRTSVSGTPAANPASTAKRVPPQRFSPSPWGHSPDPARSFRPDDVERSRARTLLVESCRMPCRRNPDIPWVPLSCLCYPFNTSRIRASASRALVPPLPVVIPRQFLEVIQQWSFGAVLVLDAVSAF